MIVCNRRKGINMDWKLWWLIIFFGSFILVSLILWIGKITGISYKLYIKYLDQESIEFYLSLDTNLLDKEIDDWCRYHKKKIINKTIVDMQIQ
jgi:hypothetical protein